MELEAESYSRKLLESAHIPVQEMLKGLIAQTKTYGFERITFTGLTSTGQWNPAYANVTVVAYDPAAMLAAGANFQIRGAVARWMMRVGQSRTAGEANRSNNLMEISHLFGIRPRPLGFKRIALDVELNHSAIREQRLTVSEAWQHVADELEYLFQQVDTAGIQDNLAVSVVLDF